MSIITDSQFIQNLSENPIDELQEKDCDCLGEWPDCSECDGTGYILE